MACKRSSKPTLSALNTSFTSPAMTQSPSVFSSATISSMASSFCPSPTVLRHPSPRRYEALNSPLLKSDMTLPQFSTPPPRPISPLSPLVAHKQTFFDSAISPAEYGSHFSPAEYGSHFSPIEYGSHFSPAEYGSPFSSTSEYYCLRQGTDFRQQWSNVADAPTPPPQTTCPNLPPTVVQRAAIRRWQSRVNHGAPAPPSPSAAAATFDHNTSMLMSPIEQDIQKLSLQISEIHQSLARSDSLFKQGMMSVYLQQNAAAARLASSPTDNILPEDIIFRPSSVDSVSSTASFHRRARVAHQRAAEAKTRAMLIAQERESQRKDFLKMTLMDRIEREVTEIECRAIRDLEMVREARYALRMEIEREQARERRRALEIELAIERQRQAALEAQREDEEEAARLLASLNAATEAIVQTETAENKEEDNSEECFFHFSIDMPVVSESSISECSSPSLTHSASTRPSTSNSSDGKPPALALRCVLAPVQPQQAVNSPISLKSPLFNFLASPISPCSPNMPVAFTFSSARSSLNMEFGLGVEFADADISMIEGTNGVVAACA